MRSRLTVKLSRIDHLWTVRPQTVSVTSKGRASIHVYNGQFGRLEKAEWRQSPQLPSSPEKNDGASPSQDHENFQHPGPTGRNDRTMVPVRPTGRKEGLPSNTKKFFKPTFTPFLPSLEFPSYDITYVT